MMVGHGKDISRRQRRSQGRGVALGGAALAWGVAAVTGMPFARADVLDAVVDPVVTAAAAAVSHSTDIGALLTTDTSWTTNLSSVFGSTLELSHAAASETAATNATNVVDTVGTVAADPANATVPLTTVTHTIPEVGLTGIEGEVSISVNGGTQTSAIVDTGSAGLLVPIQDVGLQNLGLPVGFESLTYGTAELSQNIFAAEFNAPIDFGDGIVTHPTEIAVPLFTTVHETFDLVKPIDLGPFGSIDSIPLSFSFPDIPPFTDMYGVEPILGIGAAGTLPGNPVTEALPGDLSHGVLIDVADHTLTFGPNPLDAETTINGNPLATLEVQIGDGPLTTVTAAIDSGGQYGSVPASLLTASEITPVTFGNASASLIAAQEVTPGTVISVYTPDGELLYQTTTTADATPTVTDSGNLFNTGLTPFLNHAVFIGYGPNDGSPGMTGFTPDTGFTIIDK